MFDKLLQLEAIFWTQNALKRRLTTGSGPAMGAYRAPQPQLNLRGLFCGRGGQGRDKGADMGMGITPFTTNSWIGH